MTGYIDIISWDCANKTLAWSHVTINVNIYKDIIGKKHIIEECMVVLFDLSNDLSNELSNEIIQKKISNIREKINEISDLLLNFIVFHSSGVVDMLNGKKLSEVSDIEKTTSLCTFLNKNFKTVKPNTYVFIEHQPIKLNFGCNFKNSAPRPDAAYVEHKLLYHFVNIGVCNILQIDSNLRKKVCFGKNLDHDYFLQQGLRLKNAKDAKYWASKEHSKQNFLKLMKDFNQEHHIVKNKACLDDQADSVTQIFAYLLHNNMFKF
jgi:hypothetical protein